MRTISPPSRPILRLWKSRLDRPPVLKSKVEARSWKNWRFSGKKSGKRVRLICWSSASTCAKSVLAVRSSARLEVGEYFTSSPTSVVGSRSVRHSAGRASRDSASTGVCRNPATEYGVT